MTAPHDEWKVLPHGPLTQVGTGVWCVEGEIPMPLMHLPRRMTVVRIRDGGLVVWSAIAVDATTLAAIEAVGRPAFLVVPSEHHRLDAAAWKKHFPALQVVAPVGSRAKIEEVVPVDTCTPDFADPEVRFTTVQGTRDEEAALLVRRSDGTTLVLNDIIGNIRHSAGFGGWVLRRMGLAGDAAQVPTAVALLVVKDKEALSKQLLRWSDLPDLRRIVVSHGEVIEAQPQQTLHDLALAL